MANAPMVLLVGDFSGERVDLAALCERFGWKAKAVPCLDGELFHLESGVVAAIVDVTPDNAPTLLRACQQSPRIAWIACCRFGTSHPLLEAEHSGIFHLIRRPLHPQEVLQSLGFVDAQISRRRREVITFPRRGAAA